LHIEVPAVPYKELRNRAAGVASAEIRARVESARQVQRDRGFYNSQLPPAQLRAVCALDDTGEKTLKMAMRRMNLSARAHDRLLRVARTIADLDHAPNVAAKHLAAVVESRILLIRGQKVLLDSDLAALYQVTTGNLNKSVHRKYDRFPDDFMFQLSPAEADSLRFQIGRSKNSTARGGRRFCPSAFTEQGIAMLSGVLNSARAVQVNIAIMRTFVRLGQLLATHEELARRLDQLEWRQSEQDGRVQYVFETIQGLIEAPAEPVAAKRGIGFPTSRSS
jgi:hypothetical protein